MHRLKPAAHLLLLAEATYSNEMNTASGCPFPDSIFFCRPHFRGVDWCIKHAVEVGRLPPLLLEPIVLEPIVLEPLSLGAILLGVVRALYEGLDLFSWWKQPFHVQMCK